MANEIIDLALARVPGRPISVGRQPSAARRERLAEGHAALAEHVAGDHLVAAAHSRERGRTLREVQVQTAIEAANLAWERTQHPLYRREFARITSRRIAALVQLARVTIDLDQLDPGGASPATLVTIANAFRASVEDAAQEVLPAADFCRFTSALERRWPNAEQVAQFDRQGITGRGGCTSTVKTEESENRR